MQDIIAAIPPLCDWIDRLRDRYADQAAPVDAQRWRRVDRYFSASLLHQTMLVFVDQVPVIPLEGLETTSLDFENSPDNASISFDGYLFLHRDAGDRETVLFHEMVHVVQWREAGIGGFLLLYIVGNRRSGYLNNPLEAMAYDMQARFAETVVPFNAELEVARATRRIIDNFRAESPETEEAWRACREISAIR